MGPCHLKILIETATYSLPLFYSVAINYLSVRKNILDMYFFLVQGTDFCKSCSLKTGRSNASQIVMHSLVYRMYNTCTWVTSLPYRAFRISSLCDIIWNVMTVMDMCVKVSLNSFSRGAGNQWSERMPLFVWLAQATIQIIKTPLCNDMCPNHWSQVPLIYLFSSTLKQNSVYIICI